MCGSRSRTAGSSVMRRPGVLDDGLRAELAARKEELLALVAGAETALEGPRSLVPLSRPVSPAAVRPTRPQRGRLLLPRPRAASRPAAASLRRRAQGPGRQPYGRDGRGNRGVRGRADPWIPARGAVLHRGLLRRRHRRLRVGKAARSGRRAEVARVLLFGSPVSHAYRAVAQMACVLRHSERPSPAPHGRPTAGSLSDRLEYIRSRAPCARGDAWRSGPARRSRSRGEPAPDRGSDAGRGPALRARALRRAGRRVPAQRGLAPRGRSARRVEARGRRGGRARGARPNATGDYMLREPHVPALAALLNPSLRDEGGRHAAG